MNRYIYVILGHNCARDHYFIAGLYFDKDKAIEECLKYLGHRDRAYDDHFEIEKYLDEKCISTIIVFKTGKITEQEYK